MRGWLLHPLFAAFLLMGLMAPHVNAGHSDAAMDLTASRIGSLPNNHCCFATLPVDDGILVLGGDSNEASTIGSTIHLFDPESESMILQEKRLPSEMTTDVGVVDAQATFGYFAGFPIGEGIDLFRINLETLVVEQVAPPPGYFGWYSRPLAAWIDDAELHWLMVHTLQNGEPGYPGKQLEVVSFQLADPSKIRNRTVEDYPLHGTDFMSEPAVATVGEPGVLLVHPSSGNHLSLMDPTSLAVTPLDMEIPHDESSDSRNRTFKSGVWFNDSFILFSPYWYDANYGSYHWESSLWIVDTSSGEVMNSGATTKWGASQPVAFDDAVYQLGGAKQGARYNDIFRVSYDAVSSNGGGTAGASDSDGDGVPDDQDECPHEAANPDADGDGCNDASADHDDDGVADSHDNCPQDSNSDQADADGDGAGDSCDDTPDGPDSNGNGANHAEDDSSTQSNPGQADADPDMGPTEDEHASKGVPAESVATAIAVILLVSLACRKR